MVAPSLPMIAPTMSLGTRILEEEGREGGEGSRDEREEEEERKRVIDSRVHTLQVNL